MINGLQLAVHLPLFALSFPSNANFFISFLIEIATFDILPGDVPNLIFNFPEKDSFNEAFAATKYDSMYAIANLGTCFMLINFYLGLLFIYGVLTCFRGLCTC